MLTDRDFDELRIQAQGAAETGGTVFEADPAVILALFEGYDAHHAATPGAQSASGTDGTDEADDLLDHGWRLRQDEPLPDGALEVLENLASVGVDCGAGTAHAAALGDDDRAISTYGVLLDDDVTVGVAVDCETGTLRWVSRPTEQS